MPGIPRLLAVLRDQGVEHLGVLERLAHHRSVRDADAVVAERDGAARVHRAELGQLLALAPLRDRADGQHVGQVHAFRFAADELDHALVVQRGLGVGHAADGREPAAHRAR
jgi:hypothetical protein